MKPVRADAKPNELRNLRELDGLISAVIHRGRNNLPKKYRITLRTIHSTKAVTNINNHIVNVSQCDELFLL